MGLRTPLYEAHQAAGAKIVDFGGWDMPLHYGSQLAEHRAVREHAGLFDVSHMTVVDLEGDDARGFLRRLLANDVDRIEHDGGALYSCMCNEQGGVVDDLIVYRRDLERFRAVVNAATRAKDLEWMRQTATGFDVVLQERADLAMIAVQGPRSRSLVAGVCDPDLADALGAVRRFNGLERDGIHYARTGYTGEDGYEIMLPAARAESLWDRLVEAGAAPCGLGARDSLRLEAGLNLYGQDMDETVTPLESNLGWTIAWSPDDREFVGRAALERLRAAGGHPVLLGLVLQGRGVLRHEQKVFCDDREIGTVTSGGFGPTVGRSVALARLSTGGHDAVTVEVRDRRLPARVVTPPFVKNGAVDIEV